MPGTASCAACGARELRAHLSVAGNMGEEGLIPSTARFGTALADIVRCARCGHMQLDPMPEEAMLSRAYSQAASPDYVGEEAGQRETARRALVSIESRVPERTTLLDLGCWVGFLLAEARERGWTTVGVEPSQFGAEYARSRLGLEVLNCDLLSAPLPSGAFQAVTMGDVIEHFTDPGAALRRVHGLLRAGGVLWLAAPDAGSRVARTMGRRWWSVIPTHVQYFTRHSLATLLQRSGFEVIEMTTAPKAFSARYYLERVGGYWPPLAHALVRAADAARLSQRMWAPDFRDRMAVIARPLHAPSCQ